jgi:hypothetical protein
MESRHASRFRGVAPPPALTLPRAAEPHRIMDGAGTCMYRRHGPRPGHRPLAHAHTGRARIERLAAGTNNFLRRLEWDGQTLVPSSGRRRAAWPWPRGTGQATGDVAGAAHMTRPWAMGPPRGGRNPSVQVHRGRRTGTEVAACHIRLLLCPQPRAPSAV